MRAVIEEFSRRPGNAGRLTLDVGGGISLMRKVDIDAFAIALRNLIENALTHGAAGMPVSGVITQDGTVVVGGTLAFRSPAHGREDGFEATMRV